MTVPAISVIVPVFNAEAYLRQCIESVLAQTFTDWQLIIVDDGSTDGSASIYSRFLSVDKRISLISKPNGGLSSARNAGIDAAEGSFLFFLDADDELYPHTLSTLYSIACDTGADITIGRAVNTTVKPSAPLTELSFSTIDPHQLCIDTLYQKTATDNSACWRLFRRRLFDGIRFYDGWYEDLEIFHRLLMRARTVAVTDCIVYFYRKHPGSFIRSWSEGRRDIVSVTQSIIDLYASDPDLLAAAKNRYFSANYNLLLALMRNRPDDRAAIDRCLSVIRQLRREVICNPDSRAKDRLGAIASFFGSKFIKLLS